MQTASGSIPTGSRLFLYTEHTVARELIISIRYAHNPTEHARNGLCANKSMITI